MNKTIFVVIIYNGILKNTCAVGASFDRKEAEEIEKRHQWQSDKSAIHEVPFGLEDITLETLNKK